MTEIAEGYQQTEVGVIPIDWEVKKLTSIADVKTGPFGSALHEKDYVEDGIPIITVEHLGELGVVHENLPRVSDSDKKRLSAYILQTGDIVFSRVGSVDRSSLISEVENGWLFSSRLLRVRLNNKKVCSAYLNYHFHQESTKQRIKSVAVGQTMASLNTAILKNIEVILPPTKEEQKAIAQALSDVEAAIAELDRLITKKRNIRQGATQQLLTGKKRLSGFGQRKGYKQTEIGIIPEDWNVHKISDLVDNNRIPSGIYKEKGLYGKGTKIIKIGDVFSFDYFTPANAQRVFLNKDELLIYRVCVNDIFIALASVKLEGVGKVMLVTHLDEDTAYDHNVALIRANNLVEPRFLFYLFKSNLIRKQVAKLSTQVGTTFLKSSTILAFHLAIPALKAEQTSIAAVLSDIDIEIEALEQKRDKYKAIKQGMMQELLTGRTRLI